MSLYPSEAVRGYVQTLAKDARQDQQTIATVKYKKWFQTGEVANFEVAEWTGPKRRIEKFGNTGVLVQVEDDQELFIPAAQLLGILYTTAEEKT